MTKNRIRNMLIGGGFTFIYSAVFVIFVALFA